MDYELCKKLENAGFPFKKLEVGDEIVYEKELGQVYDDKLGIVNEVEDGIRVPALAELINACGMGFRSLSLHSDGRWIAKSGHRALPTKQMFTGKTAEESIAKLYLKLNKNNE